MRRAAKRDDAEPAIVEAFRLAGASVWKLNDPSLPDLLVGWRGHTIPVEVKTGRAKLRPGQDMKRLTWRGTPVEVIRSAEEARALVAAWRALFATRNVWRALYAYRVLGPLSYQGESAPGAHSGPNRSEGLSLAESRKHDGGH